MAASSRTTSLKRAENQFILQVSISQESLKTQDSSKSFISTILSESDFQNSDGESAVCQMSEDEFKLRIEKYV